MSGRKKKHTVCWKKNEGGGGGDKWLNVLFFLRGRSRCYPEWLGITQMPPLSLPSRPTSLKNLPYRRVVTRLSTPNVVDCTRRSSYPLKTFFLYFKCRQIVIDPTAKWSARHPNGKPHPTRHCLYIRMLYLSRCVCVCDHIKKEKKKKKSRESSGPMYYPTPDFSGECLDRFLFVPPILLSTVLPSPPVWRV